MVAMNDITPWRKISTPFLPARLRAADHALHRKPVPNRLEFRRYRLPFREAVRTAHGLWREREGLLLRLEDEAGGAGFGEVAPIPWFGTETPGEAEALLAGLGGAVDAGDIERIDERRGCLRFALGLRAWARSPAAPVAQRLPVAALLPAGKAALRRRRTGRWQQGLSPSNGRSACWTMPTNGCCWTICWRGCRVTRSCGSMPTARGRRGAR